MGCCANSSEVGSWDLGEVVRNGASSGATINTMPTTKALLTNEESEAATDNDTTCGCE